MGRICLFFVVDFLIQLKFLFGCVCLEWSCTWYIQSIVLFDLSAQELYIYWWRYVTRFGIRIIQLLYKLSWYWTSLASWGLPLWARFVDNNSLVQVSKCAGVHHSQTMFQPLTGQINIILFPL